MRARRRFAQHFLEPVWVRKVVDAIAPRPGETFLEVGPGTGSLTVALAARGARVVAIEIDRDLVDRLRRGAPDSVRIVEGDVLRANLEALVGDVLSEGDVPAVRAGESGSPLPAGGVRLRIAGNLPYNISSPVLFRLMRLARSTGRVADAALMLQEEVAARVVASPGSGDYGPLGIMVQLRADAKRLLALPPGAFRPPPSVHSALVGLAFRPPAIPVADEAVFESLVRAIFTQRRKTLANALRSFASARGRSSVEVIAGAGIDGCRRPETLTLVELAALSAAFNPTSASAVL